jgi:hypothetical protein
MDYAYVEGRAVLERFGTTPAAAREALVRQQGAFEALWPALQAHWEEPLGDDAWCPAQVTEHVLKASARFSKALYLLRRDEPLPEVPRVAGTFRNARAQAPAAVMPGPPQPLAALKPQWDEVHARLLAEADATREWHGRTLFHAFFGDLDALGWLQVAAFHLRHHRKQLEPFAPPRAGSA